MPPFGGVGVAPKAKGRGERPPWFASEQTVDKPYCAKSKEAHDLEFVWS